MSAVCHVYRMLCQEMTLVCAIAGESKIGLCFAGFVESWGGDLTWVFGAGRCIRRNDDVSSVCTSGTKKGFGAD